MGPVTVIVPGRLETATGGYHYDRRVIAGLRDRGWAVSVRELEDSFPTPTLTALEEARQVFADVADEATVLVDGLAFGAMPDVIEREAARLRLVALVHHPLAEETGMGEEPAARFRVSERRALTAARLVVVTSQATAALLADYGVGADQIAVVEPGTDRAPLAVGSRGGPTCLLCVATLIPRKGHDRLIRALASIADRRWHLTCVGSLERHPATVERLRVELRARGLEDRVSLVGEVEAAALADYYHHADVFVLASEYEGYGMAVAEALARGLPIVATRTGAVSDLVAGSVCSNFPDLPPAGILVPPGDEEALAEALEHVLSGPLARARFAEGARRRREGLRGWDTAAEQMADVLRRVANDERLQR